MLDKNKLFEETLLDKNFIENAQKFRNNYNNRTCSDATREIAPLLSEDTITRIFDWAQLASNGQIEAYKNNKIDFLNVPSKRSNDKTSITKNIQGLKKNSRDQVGFIVDPLKSTMTYTTLANLIGQTKPEFDTLKEYEGVYYYFRYFPAGDEKVTPEDHSEKFKYVMGKIEISSNQHTVDVTHWSHNYNKGTLDGKPEHTGFAFHHERRLILTMYRNKVIRTVTAQFYDGGILKPIDAVVQTVLHDSSKPPKSIFTSQVILVHEKNTEDFERFSNNENGALAFQTHIKKNTFSKEGVFLIE